MKPVLCKAGQQLREQFDDTFPDRDRRSDGWIGDLRHSARPSDHNPDPTSGMVRAIDVDRDVHKSGKPDPRMGWRWRKYSGSNPHNHHCHISFTKQGDADSSFFNIPLLGGK